jgi:ribosomal protein S4E
MKPESKCIIIDGVHVGASGIIQEIKQGSMHSPKSVMVKGSDGSSFETLAKNIMVIN